MTHRGGEACVFGCYFLGGKQGKFDLRGGNLMDVNGGKRMGKLQMKQTKKV